MSVDLIGLVVHLAAGRRVVGDSMKTHTPPFGGLPKATRYAGGRLLTSDSTVAPGQVEFRFTRTQNEDRRTAT